MTLERERIVTCGFSFTCPVCGSAAQLLTLEQAAQLLQVKTACIRDWITLGKLHGIETPGGEPRVCNRSFCS